MTLTYLRPWPAKGEEPTGSCVMRDEVAERPLDAGGQSGAFLPVLLGSRAAVIEGERRRAIDDDRCHTSAPRVPLAGSPSERCALPGPVQAVGADGMLGRHAVGCIRIVEGVAGGPEVPNSLVLQQNRVLDAIGLVARQHRTRGCGAEAFGLPGLDEVDAPVLRAGGRAADIDSPGAVLGSHDGGSFERLRSEVVLVEHGQCLEGQPVG